jgi:hypothetical protein
MATDYDKAKLTDREKKAGKNQNALADYSDNTLTGVAKYNRNSAKNIADWNESQQTDITNKNAANTSDIAEYNAGATKNQFKRQIANYDFANRQNAALRDTQFKQASRKSEAERFEAQRNLQNAALGLFGTMNQAMNGSTVGNTMRMLENRNDAENSTYWQNLQDNRNAIQNAYDESYNQNQVAKQDAAINAIKALQDIQGDLSGNLNNIQTDLYSNLSNIRGDLMTNLSNNYGDLYANRRNLRADTAANLNNINPNLYVNPAKKMTGLGDDISIPSSGYNVSQTSGLGRIGSIMDKRGNLEDTIYKRPGSNSRIAGYQNDILSLLRGFTENQPTLLDYIMPANAEQNVRNRRNVLRGNDYFSRLVNKFN